MILRKVKTSAIIPYETDRDLKNAVGFAPREWSGTFQWAWERALKKEFQVYVNCN